jgi:hypothetical protein
MRFHASNSMPEPFGNNLHISRKEHEPALRMLGALMSRMKMDIKLVVVDTEQRVVSTWLQAFYDFKPTSGEPEEKNYMIEYVWITHHNETGDKITWMEEVCRGCSFSCPLQLIPTCTASRCASSASHDWQGASLRSRARAMN